METFMILSFPIAFLIPHENSYGKLMQLGIIGITIMSVHLWFAHWLGKKIK